MPEIRRLTREHVRAAAAMLGRAFADSPAYVHALGHLAPERQERTLRRVKRGFVEAAVRHHDAHAIWQGETLAGASIVLKPGAYPPSLAVEAWWAWGGAGAGVRGIARLLRLRSYIDSRHIREPHYYLFVLGVEPAFHGQGLGKALLRALHDRVDADGACAYLETEKAINVKLYESVGYRVLTDETVPGTDGLRMWTMRRAPRPAASSER